MWKTWKSAFFVAAYAKQPEETCLCKVDFLWGKGRFLHTALTGRQTATKQEAAPQTHALQIACIEQGQALPARHPSIIFSPSGLDFPALGYKIPSPEGRWLHSRSAGE
jgi:hypothetical protein